MPDWDADSPRLRRNLTLVLRAVRASALRRDLPAVNAARTWHREMMAGLDVPKTAWVGQFRGERGLGVARVWVGTMEGVPPAGVATQLAQFERRLQSVVAAVDQRFPAGLELDADGIAAVIDLSAWAHAEWIRIHPLANGNGRTARIWANFLLMRYGLPPVFLLRPRPDGEYAAAAVSAMAGKWKPTAAMLKAMLLACV